MDFNSGKNVFEDTFNKELSEGKETPVLFSWV